MQTFFEVFICTKFHLSQLAWLIVFSPPPFFPHFSDEDIDVGALVKSWLSGQPEESCSNLENWLGDYFQRALDWVLKQVTFAISSFYILAQK